MTDCWNVSDWHAVAQNRQRRRLRTHVIHSPDCSGAEACGGVYRCGRCRKLYGWCCGAWEGDERDDYCDDCAAAVTCRDCGHVLRRGGLPSAAGKCKNGCHLHGETRIVP